MFIVITFSKMNAATLVGCALFGRTLKYIIMAELAIVAPDLLKFFGSPPTRSGANRASKRTVQYTHETTFPWGAR